MMSDNSNQKKKNKVTVINPAVKEITVQNASYECDFCCKSELNALEWGPMYSYQGVTLHYFCLLFSSGLSQNGSDSEGILGFLIKDIKAELRRGAKLRCKFCRKTKATVGCSVKTCKYSYHYPCGLENGCVFEFMGNFQSFCSLHRKILKIPIPKKDWECPICFCDFDEGEIPLWPPCCKKAVFHRLCILQMAKSHGYFFRCPLCNAKKRFVDAMKKTGIYVPERDASWELEPNAFQELTQSYSNCDAERCLCPKGRSFNEKHESDWKIVRCGGCAASATHFKCANLTLFSWKCDTCLECLRRPTRITRDQIYDSDTDDEVELNMGGLEPLPQVLQKNLGGEVVSEDMPTFHSFSWQKERSVREKRRTAIKRAASKKPSDSVVFNEGYGKKYAVLGANAPSIEADSDSSSLEPPSSKYSSSGYHQPVRKSSTSQKVKLLPPRTAGPWNVSEIYSESCSSSSEDSQSGYIVGGKSYTSGIQHSSCSVSCNCSRSSSCSESNYYNYGWHDNLSGNVKSFCNGSLGELKYRQSYESIRDKLLKLPRVPTCIIPIEDCTVVGNTNNSSDTSNGHRNLAFLSNCNNLSARQIRKSTRFRRAGLPFPRQTPRDYQPSEPSVALDLSLMRKTRLFQEGEDPKRPPLNTKDDSDSKQVLSKTDASSLLKFQSILKSKSQSPCDSKSQLTPDLNDSPCSSASFLNMMKEKAQMQLDLYNADMAMTPVPFYHSTPETNDDYYFAPVVMPPPPPQPMMMMNPNCILSNSDVMKQLDAFFTEPSEFPNLPHPHTNDNLLPLPASETASVSESENTHLTLPIAEAKVDDHNNNQEKGEMFAPEPEKNSLPHVEKNPIPDFECFETIDKNQIEESELNPSIPKSHTKSLDTELVTVEDSSSQSSDKSMDLAQVKRLIDPDYIDEDSTTIVYNRPARNETNSTVRNEPVSDNEVEIIDLNDDSDSPAPEIKSSPEKKSPEFVRPATVLKKEMLPASPTSRFKADVSSAFMSMIQNQQSKRRESQKYFSGSLDKSEYSPPAEISSLTSSCSSSDDEIVEVFSNTPTIGSSFTKGTVTFFNYDHTESSTPHDYWYNYSRKVGKPLSHVASLMLKAGKGKGLSFYSGHVNSPTPDDDKGSSNINKNRDSRSPDGTVSKKRRLF